MSLVCFRRIGRGCKIKGDFSTFDHFEDRYSLQKKNYDRYEEEKKKKKEKFNQPK